MNLIKGAFSRRLASRFPIWQRGFADHLILNRDHFNTRRDYIHQNPVRARLVESPDLYPWSSAYRKPNNEEPPNSAISTSPQTRKGTRSRVP